MDSTYDSERRLLGSGQDCKCWCRLSGRVTNNNENNNENNNSNNHNHNNHNHNNNNRNLPDEVLKNLSKRPYRTR